MRKLFAQWWHSRVLRHDQSAEEWYLWPELQGRSDPASIRIQCACGAVWRHDA